MGRVADPHTNGDTGVQVLDRAVGILSAIASRGPLSLAQLVEATELPRPTAHRLAVALESHGLVRRDVDGRFRLGGRLVAWGALAGRAWPIVEAAQPVLDHLRDATGESTQLFVQDGARRLCVANSERASGLRDTVPLGAALPIDKGSGGTVLLAFSGAKGKRFDAVRARGWAESVGEREAGVASVSAPVLSVDGRLLGAISASGPVDRLGRSPGKRLSRAVLAAARELSVAVRE
jgi:DNA-binding IclR family transcriptional regulator